MTSMRAVCVELARNAWDFHDAAVGVQHLLDEPDTYQVRATLLIACLIHQSLELALRAYVLSVDPSRTHVRSGKRDQDLRSLFCEANELGLRQLIGLDESDVRALDTLEQLCSLAPLQHYGTAGEAVPSIVRLRELCEKVLEALQRRFMSEAGSYGASAY